MHMQGMQRACEDKGHARTRVMGDKVHASHKQKLKRKPCIACAAATQRPRYSVPTVLLACALRPPASHHCLAGLSCDCCCVLLLPPTACSAASPVARKATHTAASDLNTRAHSAGQMGAQSLFLRAIGSRQREGTGCWAHLFAMMLGLDRSGMALSMKTEKTGLRRVGMW